MKKVGMRDRTVAFSVAAAIALGGCATASHDIASSYVSPMQYQSYDCDQIAAEIARIRGRVNQLGGRLDEAAANDKAIMGVGLILFWPALFALGGTKQQEAEYARLKGEYEALEQVAVQKKCLGGSPAGPAAAAPAVAPVANSAPAASAQVPSAGGATGPVVELNLRPTTGSVETGFVPGLIGDRVLAVGGRTIELNTPTWVLVTRQQGVAQGNPSTSNATTPSLSGPMYEGAAAEVVAGRVQRVIWLSAPTKPVSGVQRWVDEPCKVAAPIFKNSFGSGFDTPECLYVRRVVTDDEPALAPVVRLAQRNRLDVPDAYYEIVYSRYVIENFVRTRVYVPAESMKSDSAAIAWAQTWAGNVRPLAGRMGSRISMPPL